MPFDFSGASLADSRNCDRAWDIYTSMSMTFCAGSREDIQTLGINPCNGLRMFLLYISLHMS